MIPLIGAVFFASLFGSLHCVGMCGPLAVLASSSSAAQSQQRRSNLAAVAAYHGSRTLAYAVAGWVVGLLGAGIQHTGGLLGMQRLAAQLAGGSMLVIGLLGVVRLAGGTGHAAMLPRWLQRHLASGHAWARRQPPVPRAATIGLLTALLPCGWLYAFLIVAAGTARPLDGAIVMAVFALGAVPALAGTALSVVLLTGRFRRAIPWGSALLVTAVGAMTLFHRSQIVLEPMSASRKSLSSESLSSSKISAAKLTSHVAAIDQSKLPCCCDDASERNQPHDERCESGSEAKLTNETVHHVSR
jgi:sulfite exporter TauE/SafE